jgi:signal transduction histidine kinase
MNGRSDRKPVTAAVLPVLLCLGRVLCQGQSRESILVVYQDQATIPAFADMQSALFQRLWAERGPGIQLFVEQLESSRFPEERAARLEQIRARYAKQKVDAVIYLGSPAAEILAGVPTVNLGNLPDEGQNFKSFHAPVAAVWWGLDPAKTVSAARRLQPKADKVLLLAGLSSSDQFYLKQFRSRLTGLESQIQIETVGNDSVEQMMNRVSHLSPNTIVLMISYARDPEGRFYAPLEVTAKVAQVSTAPVYGVSDTYVGTGIVGGYVISWRKVGVAAADAALALIRGKPPAEIAPASTSEYMFDWRQLKRWGFKESDLPPGSVVEFKTETVLEQYRWRIVGAIVLIVGQFLLIGGLLIQRHLRRRAEDSLRRMAGRLLQTQDEERRRLARELHDGTGQHLSGIALSVGQVLADFPPGHESLRQLLQSSYTTSREALDEVRAVSYALHPPMLDGIGLVPALRWYLDGLQKRTKLRVDFEAPADLAGGSVDQERAIFRVVQESVTNVLRHSGGNALKVRLADDGKGITLEIEDNGHGMSSEDLQRARGTGALGVGIAGMRERVQQLHGTFDISSDLLGTRVSVSLPTKDEKYAAYFAG